MSALSRRLLLGGTLIVPFGPRPFGRPLWPTAPVRLVVPFGAGGAIDTLARALANAFPAHANGQPLVVENRSGAGGTIAGLFVAQSRPDGYTLMVADLGANAIGKLLQPSLPYDPATAFTAITHLVNLPLALVVRGESRLRDLTHLIEEARKAPGRLTYASAGVGNLSHIVVELLARRAGIQVTAVHYRSGADVMRAVLAGETDFGFPSVSTALPFLRDGKARALAVGSANPVPVLPEVRPVADLLPGFEVMIWHGIVGPAGMDRDLVARIDEVFRAIITNPEVRSFVETRQAAEVVAAGPNAFATFVARQIALWTPVIKEGGIRAD